MTPIVREFFRGLRERDELDVIVPELLTAMGFEVLSRPMTGTSQYGSDVAAVGTDTDGVRKLFLFSIKRGDLNRAEWNGATDQALRPSLDDVRDAYLNSVAPEHKALPVVICITIGGVVLENVLPRVNGYMRENTTPKVSYRIWSGDTLTGKVLDGALREEVFPAELRSDLRKAAAMVEEPDVAMQYFGRLVRIVADDTAQEPAARVRILYLALWILFVWGREADNLEAPYRASELVVLRAWELLWPAIETDKGRKLEASHTFHEAVQLHLRIWDRLYRGKMLKHAASRHALSFAVGSSQSIDINLMLFETVGRVAIGGLWQLWMASPTGDAPRLVHAPPAEAEELAHRLAAMITANPVLLTPVADDQAIDIALALMFLASVPATRIPAVNWTRQLTGATRMAYRHHLRYPITDQNYSTLIRHPAARTPKYREEMTKGSILYPLLAMFAVATGDTELAETIAAFQSEDLGHCNFQTWVPNARTEDKIWHGDRWQGSSLGGLQVVGDGSGLLDALRKEAAANTAYPALSAIKLDHWPVLLIACRHFRLPVPPQLWLALLDDLAEVETEDEPPPMLRRAAGGIRPYRRGSMGSTSILAYLIADGVAFPAPAEVSGPRDRCIRARTAS